MVILWPLAPIDTPALDGTDQDTREAITDTAVDFLYRWTGGVYGLTEAKVRPIRTPVQSVREARGKWQPVAVGGGWAAVQCEQCAGQFCCCDRPVSLRFPFRVESVTEVLIDGAPIVAFELVGHRTLYRTDGKSWPTWQRLTQPVTEEETFQVTLTRGVPVPEGGRIAAAVLAEEIAKAVTGDGSCRLPARVQTITRQGVTVGMFDSMEDLADGETGIWLVDSWLKTVTNAPRIGGVWSPDHDPGRVVL